MIIKGADMTSEIRENMRGGQGQVDILHIVGADHLPAKSRLFSLVTLEKGCGIGAHPHSGETEVYYVLEGEGIIDDNGEKKPFVKGDCNVCGDGATHAVTNEKEEPLKIIAVIIKD